LPVPAHLAAAPARGGMALAILRLPPGAHHGPLPRPWLYHPLHDLLQTLGALPTDFLEPRLVYRPLEPLLHTLDLPITFLEETRLVYCPLKPLLHTLDYFSGRNKVGVPSITTLAAHPGLLFW
jgi:hypothetical protein